MIKLQTLICIIVICDQDYNVHFNIHVIVQLVNKTLLIFISIVIIHVFKISILEE